MNVIPCLTWVRRGIAKSMPDKVQLSKEELRKIIEETKGAIDENEKEWSDVDSDDTSADEDTLEGATAPEPKSQKVKPQTLGKRKKREEVDEPEVEDGDVVKKYGLDDYDENDDEIVNPLHGIGKLAFYSSNDDDPYITLKDEDSDEEDFEIKPSDNLILTGRSQEDACLLEVSVFNEEYGNLYIHHDILLPSFPLAVEWLNYDPADGRTGNFVAVGTMLPSIDIWDLDLVDSLEPATTLQGKVKKKSAKKKGTVGGHADAVLDLSWNSILRTVLASASADSTVGLWDLSQGKIATSLRQHADKAQCVAWHPFEAQSLLSGSYDHTVKVYDCRSPVDGHKSWDLKGEVERVTWNHFSPFHFLASTDKGTVYCLDVRSDKPIYTLSAHTEAVTGLCLSNQVAGLLVTASSDKSIKIWDTHDSKPSLILEKDMKMNEIHCLESCPESPYTFAIGGQSELKVWDIRESASVKRHFQGRGKETVDTAAGKDTDRNTTHDAAAVAMETLNLGSTNTEQKKTKKKRKKTKKPK
ncbi:periodic tryptophan protein 1 homolog [Liolophura sinensis]|uniref:periodic tryptophan protein 1 homolog n=1 Tax=Liolophura sinensis TaxID=3198878 RepID=UPI00315861A4